MAPRISHGARSPGRPAETLLGSFASTLNGLQLLPICLRIIYDLALGQAVDPQIVRNIASFTASAHRAPIPQTCLVMKAHALAGRDKPKDAYPLCYCLDNYPGGLDKLAAAWKLRNEEMDAKLAIAILQAKSSSVEDFGSRQVVEVFDVPGC